MQASEHHPDRDQPLHEGFSRRPSCDSTNPKSYRPGRHGEAVVAVADDVMQVVIRQFEEFHRVPVPVALEPFRTQHRIVERYRER